MEILLREKTGQTIFSSLKGLTFSDGKNPGRILASDCTGLFDIAFKDTVHGIYVSENGEIVYLERLGEGWKKSFLLKSKNGRMDVFGIRLIFSEEGLNLIYGLNHNTEKLIVHQPLPDGTPKVITSSFGDSFFVRRDDSGCVYVITESADKLWQYFVLRNDVWGGPYELISDCIIKDIMTNGFKNFCILFKAENGYFMQYDDIEIAVNGENPHIVKSENLFSAISKTNGRIYCTDKDGERLLITSETVKDYSLRLPESGEYAVCEHCSGSVIHGVPRLFLIDRANRIQSHTGDSVRLELTKRIISLESRVTQLENTVRMYNPPKEQTAPPENP